MLVYLMADFGKGPRSFGRIIEHRSDGAPLYTVSQAEARDSARAWWLVEAESEDAARLTIDIFEGFASHPILSQRPHGMDIGAPGVVLDSGGAKL